MTIKSELDRAQPVIDSISVGIRENPLAAGLIGAGLAWMLLGGRKGMMGIASATAGAARTAESASVAVGRAAAGGLARAGSTAASILNEQGSRLGNSVTSIVPDLPAGEDIGNGLAAAKTAVGERLYSAASAGRDYGSTIHSRLSESLERQPLLLGAIGLAIGAGVASTFATTAMESELMGEQGKSARDKLYGLVEDVKDRASQVVTDVKAEASQQGLTLDAARSTPGQVGEKLKAVGKAGRDSAARSTTGN